MYTCEAERIAGNFHDHCPTCGRCLVSNDKDIAACKQAGTRHTDDWTDDYGIIKCSDCLTAHDRHGINQAYLDDPIEHDHGMFDNH